MARRDDKLTGTPSRGVNLLCLAGPEGPRIRATEVHSNPWAVIIEIPRMKVHYEGIGMIPAHYQGSNRQFLYHTASVQRGEWSSEGEKQIERKGLYKQSVERVQERRHNENTEG